LIYSVRQIAPVSAAPARPKSLRCGSDMMLCAEIFPASAMMAATAAQFRPTWEPWMQGLRPTWRCAWLEVEAGVVALMLAF